MNPKTRMFKGTLRIEGEYSYLILSTSVGQSIPLFLNVPTGAGFCEGFAAATHYFQQKLKKNSGANIEIRGVKSRLGKTTVIQFFSN